MRGRPVDGTSRNQTAGESSEDPVKSRIRLPQNFPRPNDFGPPAGVAMSRREFWSTNTSYSERSVDFARDRSYAEVTRQLVADRARIGRIVEVGAGSGAYLSFLASRFAVELRGTDIPNPRLDRARIAHPDIIFEGSDALSTVRKYGSTATRFLATFVLGNLATDELEDLFDRISFAKASLTFCAKGTRQRTADRQVAALVDPYHDYVALIGCAQLAIAHQHIRVSRSDPAASIYVMTVTA